MVWSNFSGYYYKPDGVAWTAWDPTLEHRRATQAWEKVNIDQAAQKYSPPAAVIEQLDRLIDQEVYECLTDGGELDQDFLTKTGFLTLKSSSTRVVYHVDFPGWLIKVGASETRQLPMESTVKAQKARGEGAVDKVWLPLRNTNLLRAAGREYFVKQLKSLDEADRNLFDFPEEYIYTSPCAPLEAPPHKKYFSIGQRKEIYSGNETLEIIKDQESDFQRLIAQKIIKFIKLTRTHDFHSGNIVLSKDADRWCFEIIDAEPLGILIDEKDEGAHLFNSEEHVLVGLICFRDSYCRKHGLTAMTEEVEAAIVDYMDNQPQLTNHVQSDQVFLDPLPTTTFQRGRLGVLIVVSILCPLVPIVLLIIAIFAACCCPSENPSHYDDFNTILHDPREIEDSV